MRSSEAVSSLFDSAVVDSTKAPSREMMLSISCRRLAMSKAAFSVSATTPFNWPRTTLLKPLTARSSPRDLVGGIDDGLGAAEGVILQPSQSE
jgi:hypothetical protein